MARHLHDMTVDEISKWLAQQPPGRIINIGPDGNELPANPTNPNPSLLPGLPGLPAPTSSNVLIYVAIGAAFLLLLMPKGK